MAEESPDSEIEQEVEEKSDHIVTFEDICLAVYRIRDAIPCTPCDQASESMRRLTGMDIYFKKDFILRTGRLKVEF